MALIGDIRKRSGLLVVIIGVALAAFVLGDFLSNRSPRRNVNLIGEVNGEKILATDFNQRVEQNIESQKVNMGRENLTAEEQFQIRQQTWEQMLAQTLMEEEVAKLGIAVTTEELDDMIRGKNPHPYIRQSFSDPETGQYNPQNVVNFLRNLDQVDPQMRQRYLSIEKAIKEDRLYTKYNNLIARGYYVPKAFAERDYMNRSSSARVRYYSLPYSTISDSLVKVTDADYKKYFEENKHKYEQEASRDIEYVSFDISASQEDKEQLEKEVNNLYTEFVATENIKDFVNSTSDERYDSTWVKRGQLPYKVDSVMFNSALGTSFGPYVENNMYQMARLVDVQTRPDSLKASHILISYAGTNVNPANKMTREQAKAKADSVLNVVKGNSTKFDEVAASTINDDKTAAQAKGDLNWFADGAMVPAFNNAVINGSVGEVKLVETQFGFHIIKITGKTTPTKKVRVAMVKLAVEPSSRTMQDIYTKASQFASQAKDKESFDKLVEENNLTKRLAERITADQNGLPGIPEAREIVRWSFDEKTDVGQVSNVFDLENRYIVALLEESREKGFATLEQVKDFIEPLVKREKKAEQIITKLNTQIKSKADLEAKYASLGMRADTSDLSLATTNLPGFGREDEVLGKTFATKAGEMSKPIKGNQAVFMVIPESFTKASPKDDYTTEKRIIQNTFISRVQREVNEALKKKAEIEDNRLLFY